MHESLCLKFNNLASNDPCHICGRRTDPVVGPELFVEGTYYLVCDDCARKDDPMLYLFRSLILEAAKSFDGDWWTERERKIRQAEETLARSAATP